MKYVEQLGSAVGKSTVKVGNVIIVILFLWPLNLLELGRVILRQRNVEYL